MKFPHANTVNKQWEIAKQALMISYTRARGTQCDQEIDFEKAMEAVKQLFKWGERFKNYRYGDKNGNK